MSSQKTLLIALFAAALMASPALAQPTDPFETIVNNPKGASEQLRNTSIDFRNPTREEIQQGLRRMNRISATITIKTGNRAGYMGMLKVEPNTTLRVRVVMQKPNANSEEAVLETLSVVPDKPMKAFGFVGFERFDYDPRSEELHGKLGLGVGGLRQAWGEEVHYEKIYTDSAGNNVMKSAGGKGISGFLNQDMRQTPDGRIQYKTPRFLFWGGNWKNLKDPNTGKSVKVPNTMTFPNWPPKATDIMEWLPEPGHEEEILVENVDGLAPLLGSIPVEHVSIAFDGQADPGRIDLSNGEGHIDVERMRVRYRANGGFPNDRKTYVANEDEENSFHVSGRISGETRREGLGSTTIDHMNIDVRGTHGGTIPFADPSKIDVWGKFDATVDGELQDSDVGLPGMPALSTPGRMLIDANASGTVNLRPLDADPSNRTALTIDEGSRYGVKVVDGTLEIDDLSATIPSDRLSFPERLVLSPKGDGTPILTAEGQLGTRPDGSVGARTHIVLDGKTTNRGAIHLIEDLGTGTPALTTTLEEGADVRLEAHTLGSINPNNLQPGPVHVTADTELNGTIVETDLESRGNRLTLPGRTKLDARVATDLVIEEPGAVQPKTQVNDVATRTTFTLEDDGTINGGLPGGPRVNGRLARGSQLTFDTGHMTRRNGDSPVLSTDGKSAKATGTLVLGDATVTDGDTEMKFEGETKVDVDADVAFAMNPDEGKPVGSIDADVTVTSQVTSGSRITVTHKGLRAARVRLGGATTFTFKALTSTNPTTGKTRVSGVEGVEVKIEANNVDLAAMLGDGVVNTSIDSRSVIIIRDASVSFLPDGRMQIHHNRITLDIAPGTITVGRTQR